MRTELTNWSAGELICVDNQGKAIRYDATALRPIIGVSIKPEENYYLNGRQWFAINGAPFYENDFYEWKEDLTSDFVSENASYAPFNPIGDLGFISAITNGFAALKTAESEFVPAGWVKIKSGAAFDWYLVR